MHEDLTAIIHEINRRRAPGAGMPSAARSLRQCSLPCPSSLLPLCCDSKPCALAAALAAGLPALKAHTLVPLNMNPRCKDGQISRMHATHIEFEATIQGTFQNYTMAKEDYCTTEVGCMWGHAEGRTCRTLVTAFLPTKQEYFLGRHAHCRAGIASYYRRELEALGG